MKLSVKKNKQIVKTIDLSSEVEGVGSGETIFVVGRSPNALIHLDDKQISREHANLIYRAGKWSIECLTEKNITVNGNSVHHSPLKSGDEIIVGIFSLEIEIVEVQDESSKMFHFDFAKNKPEENSHSDVEKNKLQKAQSNHQSDDDLLFSEEQDEKLVANVNENQNEDEIENKKIVEENHGFELDLESESQSQESTIPDEIGNSSEPESEFQDENANDELDLTPLDGSSESDDDNFEIAHTNSSVLQDLVPEDAAYSLENIDEANEDGTQLIQNFASVELVLFGENAPYDRYRLTEKETFIGRDPKKCQIVLNDSEVSSVHAVVRKNNLNCVLEDFNSSNGTLVNGERVNKVTLNNNDEFLIGSVSFTVRFKSDFLKQEAQMLMPVESSEMVEVEEVVEIPAAEGEQLDAFGGEISSAPQEKSILKRIWKDEKSRKKLIYGLVGLALVFMLLPEEPEQKPVSKNDNAKKEEKKDPIKTGPVNPNQKNLTPEEREQLTKFYQFGRKHFLEGRYREAIEEFEKVVKVDPNFNDSVQTQLALAKEGLKKIEELEKEKQKAIEEAERKEKVEQLLKDARQFVLDKRFEMAENRFSEIALLDPDNIEVPRLKLDIENWKKEIQRKELEETQKKAERQAKVQKLQPGKAFCAQKEWFKCIVELEKFLKVQDMDDDLRKEGEELFENAKTELASTVNPLLGKARSLVEGQDLKGAYETYYQILRFDPSNSEALNQTTDIKEQLTNKARKIYREAIISESLSLFQDAKEKFQEVQQISPVDSDYYKKATEKLKNYLD